MLTGAQILKGAIDFDLLLHQGHSPHKAVEELQQRGNNYNSDVLAALGRIRFQEHARILSLGVDSITVGMIAEEDITAKNGAMILPRGQKITWPVLQALYNFNRQVGIIEPIKVRTGHDEEEEEE